jgi:hypothetical protein
VIRWLFFLILSFPVGATIFARQSIETQMKEADGIILGHYLKSKSIRLEDGKIATQMIFKINKEWGMQTELFGFDEVIIHYPGGRIDDEILQVSGVPEFVAGEKVVIFAKSYKNRFWGLNMGFGTFKVVNYGKETMLINTIFPEDSQIGQINIENFEKTVREVKGSNLKVVKVLPSIPTKEVKGRSVASVPEEGKNRSLASVSEESENEETQSGFSIIWLITILAALGGFTRYIQRRATR